MSIRGYGATVTGVLGSVFGFDMIWIFTDMEAISAMFTAVIIGIFAACIFVFATEPRRTAGMAQKPTFVRDDTGLSVMIQGKRNG